MIDSLSLSERGIGVGGVIDSGELNTKTVVLSYRELIGDKLSRRTKQDVSKLITYSSAMDKEAQ